MTLDIICIIDSDPKLVFNFDSETVLHGFGLGLSACEGYPIAFAVSTVGLLYTILGHQLFTSIQLETTCISPVRLIRT